MLLLSNRKLRSLCLNTIIDSDILILLDITQHKHVKTQVALMSAVRTTDGNHCICEADKFRHTRENIINIEHRRGYENTFISTRDQVLDRRLELEKNAKYNRHLRKISWTRINSQYYSFVSAFSCKTVQKCPSNGFVRFVCNRYQAKTIHDKARAVFRMHVLYCVAILVLDLLHV